MGLCEKGVVAWDRDVVFEWFSGEICVGWFGMSPEQPGVLGVQREETTPILIYLSVLTEMCDCVYSDYLATVPACAVLQAVSRRLTLVIHIVISYVQRPLELHN